MCASILDFYVMNAHISRKQKTFVEGSMLKNRIRTAIHVYELSFAVNNINKVPRTIPYSDGATKESLL